MGARRTTTRAAALLALAVLLLVGCDDSVSPKLRDRVTYLASDDLSGRQNNTPGGLAARRFILDEMRDLAPGAIPDRTGDAAYLQPFVDQRLGTEVVGANILAMIKGTTRPDEYVIVSAHYDHAGSDCHTAGDPTDTVCNGATDNATSVALVLGLAEKLEKIPPDRSVIFAFFDAEEDHLTGSEYYVKNPIYPLAKTVALVNFDITGTRILPSLANRTYALGAETGGPSLTEAVGKAYGASSLDGVQLSAIFGRERSDHYWFLSEKVPSLFFTDISGRCYHSKADDVSIVDFAKLKRQLDVAYFTVAQIVFETPELGGIVTPTWTAAPAVTYDDAVRILASWDLAVEDLDLFTPAQQTTLTNGRATLAGIVDAGAAAFDSAAVAATATVANDLVVTLSAGRCESFLD